MGAGDASNRTIGVDLWAGQARGGPNARTCIRSATKVPDVKRTQRDLFIGAYGAFSERCRAVDEPGVAVVAVHEATGRAQGLVTLRARVERHVAAIIGRHDACDLYLAANEQLALRHLAIVLDPVASWRRGESNVRYRVLDLRTGDGFTDEHDRTLRGLICEGPALLRCGGYGMFMLPLGDPSDWPDSATDAWSMLPERVYVSEVERWPEASMPKMPRMSRGAKANHSTIIPTHGIRDTGVNLVASGSSAGTLELFGPTMSGKVRIGDTELRDGVLLGRYERCDAASFADDASISRVHALLIQIDDSIIVIDTASRNGTRLSGRADARVITLDGDAELEIGTKTRARWRFVS